MSGALSEYWVDVKKRGEDGEPQEWVATVKGEHDEPVVVASSEESVREKVRMLVLERTAATVGKPVDALQARLKRTWRVRVHATDNAADGGSVVDDDEPPLFDLFS